MLQSLALCGVCGRKLAVYYAGGTATPPATTPAGTGHLVDGKQLRHLRIGELGIDMAVSQAFLAALAGDAPAACLAAARQLSDGHDSALEQGRRQVQQARYETTKAERRYLAVDAENRLVARGLETASEKALTALAAAEAELVRRERQAPQPLTPKQQSQIHDSPLTTSQVTGPGGPPQFPSSLFCSFHAPYAGGSFEAANSGSSPRPWPSPWFQRLGSLCSHPHERGC